jgi:hypothetical protein
MCATCSSRSADRPDRPAAWLLLAPLAAALSGACLNAPAALTQLVEARRLAAAVHVEFTRASEASNRAVMAETDEASAAAVDEARRAREAVERDVGALRALLESLGYREDVKYLDGFQVRHDEYRRLDDEILPLAVENTNLKAQRLSFGPAREAADAFRTALDAAVRTGGARDCCAEALAGKAGAAVLEILVLHGPHIAEADDAAMTRMEGLMTAAAAAARQALMELKATLPASAAPQLADAGAALDRLMTTHAEIVSLSRRNSDVRSLALSLGRKRTVTAECEDQLRALGDALAKHGFTATR